MAPSSRTTAEPSTSGQRTSVAAGLLGKNPEHNTPLTTSQKVLNLLAAHCAAGGSAIVATHDT
ncbi:hypothetical protein [Rothia sp. L_38]|uniref:hypothetical protein n=1 Tax=Rothia sp. L_38 TaxID=3422315 RepID=UPI003D6A01F3